MAYIEIRAVFNLLLLLNAAEDPVYANTRPVANKHPSPRPRVQQPKDPKTLPSSQKLWTPSPGRRYDEGKRRYKE